MAAHLLVKDLRWVPIGAIMMQVIDDLHEVELALTLQQVEAGAVAMIPILVPASKTKEKEPNQVAGAAVLIKTHIL